MNKLLLNVLDKVSERNNDYRSELKKLSRKIDERTMTLVGDIVTLSNYTIDFSNAVSTSKENLVTPIQNTIDSYVIRDLRSVESVNEQFIEKISDKIDNTNISLDSEKEKFIQNLSSLLNDKYLEIVKIKRVNFFNEDGYNEDIALIINKYTEYIKLNGKTDDSKLQELFSSYVSDLTRIITETLENISNLYLSNFSSEIINALSLENVEAQNDVNNEVVPSPIETLNEFPVPEVPEVPEVPLVPTESEIFSIPEVPNFEMAQMEEEKNNFNDIKPMDEVPKIPIEIDKEDTFKNEAPKKTYDVEEILKIAKSPVASIKNDDENSYNNVSIKPLSASLDSVSDNEYNEKEIVEEMIERLKNRLNSITLREKKCEENIDNINKDEAFVEGLVNNATTKKQELDSIEQELNEKEKELNEKKADLDKRLNEVLPFANAVLKMEEK